MTTPHKCGSTLNNVDSTARILALAPCRHKISDRARVAVRAYADELVPRQLALRAAQVLLSGTDTEFAGHTDSDIDRGHGRTEHRTLRVADCDDALFPAARQVFRLRRDTGGLDGVRTSKEIVYAITSLSAGLAPPAHLNHYTRRHWTVENRLRYVRDVTFREDASQLRTGTTPRAIATFRNLSVSAFRLAGRANIAHARRDLHDRADVFAVYGI